MKSHRYHIDKPDLRTTITIPTWLVNEYKRHQTENGCLPIEELIQAMTNPNDPIAHRYLAHAWPDAPTTSARFALAIIRTMLDRA